MSWFNNLFKPTPYSYIELFVVDALEHVNAIEWETFYRRPGKFGQECSFRNVVIATYIFYHNTEFTSGTTCHTEINGENADHIVRKELSRSLYYSSADAIQTKHREAANKSIADAIASAK